VSGDYRRWLPTGALRRYYGLDMLEALAL
jgi:hypothetical protein